MDKEIRQLEDDVIKCINNVALPVEVKRLVIKDIYTQLTTLADRIIVEQQKSEVSDNGNFLQKDGMEESAGNI